MPTWSTTPPADALPASEERAENSIRWERAPDAQGRRRFNVRISSRRQFVPDSVTTWKQGGPVTWQDPDLTWHQNGNEMSVGNAYYTCLVQRNQVGDWTLRVFSKDDTPREATIRLTRIGGAATSGPSGAPVISGRDLTWVDIFGNTGVDIIVRLGMTNVEVLKRVKSDTAPRSFRWLISHTDGWDGIPRVTRGTDNADLADATRAGTGLGRVRRALQMSNTITAESVVNGIRSYTHDEQWTGFVWYRNPTTHILELQPLINASFPALIDIPVNVEITSDTDDGFGWQNKWYNSYASSNNSVASNFTGGFLCYPGFRFPSVNVPQGSTIDDATLTFHRTGPQDSNPTGTSDLYGFDTDDAPAWTNGNEPPTHTQTTAKTASVPWTGTLDVDVNVDVQSIVDEIVQRIGWVANNDMSFGADNLSTLTGDGWYVYFEDNADGAEADVPSLDINYTSAGTTITPPQGDLTLSSVAPTAPQVQHQRSGAAVDLVLSPTAPGGVVAHLRTPTTAQLVLSPTAPTAPADSLRVPPAGNLVLSSVAPSAPQLDHGRDPAAAQLSLSATAPSAVVGHGRAPAAADLILSTLAPARLTASLRLPPAVDLVLSTTAPTIGGGTNIEVPQGTLTLSTVAPSRVTASLRDIPQAALALSTTAPSVTRAGAISPPAADLGLSSAAPAATVAHLRDIPQANLTCSTTAPTVEAGGVVSPPAGDLALSTTAPTATVAHQRATLQGDLVLSVTAPDRVTGIIGDAPAGDLVLSATAPARLTESQRAPAAGDLTLSATAPVVGGARTVTPAAADLVLSSVAPTVTSTSLVAIGESTWVVPFASRSWVVPFAARTATPVYASRTWTVYR